MKKELSIDQLVSEMEKCIQAITLAEAENGIIPRLNQPKTIACLNAKFRVHEDIPDEFKHGVFATAKSYPAKIRFANATEKDDSKKDMRGFSIRLSDVEGTVLWGEPGYQDFILNSYPALFVATPEDFLTFLKARQNNRKALFFINPFDLHLKSLWIALKARKKHLSLFDVRFWSTVPSRLGETGNQVVKYSVIPCSDYKTNQVVEPGEHQLRAAKKAHLQQGPACFHFAIQKRENFATMPIEDASVIWDEGASPFQIVATITIDAHDFDSPEALDNCEKCSFNPWQSLAAHEPIGRMNEVRRLVYANAANFRSKGNSNE